MFVSITIKIKGFFMKKSLFVIVCIFSAVSLCASQGQESHLLLTPQETSELSYWKNVENLRTARYQQCCQSKNNNTLTMYYGLEVKIAQLRQRVILEPDNAQEYTLKIEQYLKEQYNNMHK